jgi:predicted lipoprotein
MRRRLIRYAIALIAFFVISYNSIYFRKLSEVKAASAATEFDAVEYAQQFWNAELIPRLPAAVDLSELVKQLNENPQKAFQDHSHALGIGNIRYVLVKGEGAVTSVNEDAVSVLIEAGSQQLSIRVATEFVYGNAVRDAVGSIHLNDFANTMHLNNVSAEINKKIRQEVIPPFLANVRKGMVVQFAGAVELNQKYLDLEDVEIIPVSVKIVQQ